MLHITNGDAVAAGLGKAGIEGRIVPWREDYTEGPVAADMEEASVRGERAQFFGSVFGIPAAEFAAGCAKQEAALAEAAASEDEIVLWFEHDLYDQAMLAQLLHRLSVPDARRQGPPLRIRLVCIGSYPGIEPFHGLGQLRPEQLAGLYPGRSPVTEEMLALGRRAWEAYAAPDPRELEALLQADTSALPYLRGAFTAHLERFPSVRDGLGRVERAALQAIASGVHGLIPLFGAATDPLPLLGIGDLQFWAMLERLRTGPRPLIRLSGAETLPRYGGPAPYPGEAVRLTPDGQDVLEGLADHVRLNGIDRILGGVRLSGAEAAWRWDPASSRLVKTGG